MNVCGFGRKLLMEEKTQATTTRNGDNARKIDQTLYLSLSHETINKLHTLLQHLEHFDMLN